MSQQVNITVRATDGSSQTFRTIASSAQSMGTAVSRAGSDASAGLAKTEAATSKAASGFKALQGATAGLVGSAVVGFLSDSARAAAEADVSSDRLRTSIEATGKSYEQYAKQIDAAAEAGLKLAFDDEDVLDALSTLTQTTGDAETALQDLAIAEDLARGKGISLATASEIVGKVAAGNTGILSRYGIVLKDGATAAEALAAIQTRYAGQAEAYGESTAGALDRARVAFANFQEEIGGILGPAQGLIALLPGLSSGFSLVSSAVGSMSGSLRSGASGFAAMLGALNPVTLGFGLAAAGAAGLVLAIHDTQEAAESARQALDGLVKAASALPSVALSKQFEGLVPSAEEVASRGVYVKGGDAARAAADLASGLTALSGAIADNNDEVFASLAAEQLLQAAWEKGDATIQQRIDATADLTEIMKDSGPAHEKVLSVLVDLNNELSNGRMTPEQYVEALHELATSGMAQMTQEARLATDANAGLTAGINTQWQAMNAQADAQNALVARSKAMREEFERQAAEVKQSAAANLGYVETADGLAGALARVAQPGESVVDVLQRIAMAGGSVPKGFAAVMNASEGMADSLNAAVGSLNTVLGLFAQVDQIGQASSSATDIAQKIVGDPGVYAVVDDLLAAGRISLEQYTAAQAAEVQIVSDNARAQENLNAVRVSMIPLLAEQEAGLADVTDALARQAEVNPELAQQSLYLMDSANAAKVASAYSTAYAASLGQIPADVATEIIADAANADPILKDILERYGLISEGADGTVTVAFPDKADLDDVQDTLVSLNNTIVDVGVALTGDPELEANRITQAVDDIPDSKTVDVKVTSLSAGLASGAGFGAAIPDDDLTVTATITADDQTGPVVAQARQAADAYASGTYAARLTAVDESGSVVAQAMQAANAYAAAQYLAHLTASNDSGGPVALAMQGANAYANGEYQAHLIASNDSGAVVEAATGAATAYATTYTATLEAVDNASAAIEAVRSALANLDGQTATVYVQQKSSGSLYDNPHTVGGGQLGKTVLPAMRHGGMLTAQSGRAVLVGEAGPEIALLPFGTQVIPHGASMARMAAGGVVGGGPSVQTSVQPNAAAAAAAGQTDAVAYYKGLLSAVRTQQQSLHDAVFGNTLFSSDAAARPALKAMDSLGREHDKLKGRLDRAREQQHRLAKAAADAGTAMTGAADDATAAISGTTAAAGKLGRLLEKAKAWRGLLGGGGGGGGEAGIGQQAIDQLVSQTISGLGQVQSEAKETGQDIEKGISRGADGATDALDSATGEMKTDLGGLSADAAQAGKQAGSDLGEGLSQGIQKSAFSDQIDSVQKQLQSIGSGRGPTADIGVNDRGATQGIQDVQQGINQLDNQQATVNVKVNDSDWQDFLNELKKTDGTTISVTVEENTKSTKDKGAKGQMLGGAVRPVRVAVPAAAMGRTVLVGEAGPELAVLPFGTQVVPHGAAQARLRDSGGGRPTITNYGPIHLHPRTAEIGDELLAALGSLGRG